MQILQRLPWPLTNEDPDLTVMYYRSPHPVRSHPVPGLYGLAPSDEIDLSTFFGAFSLTTWCGPANIDEVIVRIRVKGKCLLQIVQTKPDDTWEIHLETLISGDTEDEWHESAFKNLSGKQGILFPKITVLEEGAEFTGLEYATPNFPRFPVRLAMIMPTYKRESYVLKNIEKISKILPDYRGTFELFVIDNGQTLKPDEIPNGIRIVPNRNFGGTGGFSRGLLEAFNSRLDFTHFLFCDDDVELEIETIRRIFSLWQFLNPRSVVGGSMLSMSKKSDIYETGAYMDPDTGLLKLFTQMSAQTASDLSSYDSVYDREPINFFGWWFCSFSRLVYEELGMPIPVFVRVDDMEYGLRQTKSGFPLRTLLGLGVWHEDFSRKRASLVMDFYGMRNKRVVSLLHGTTRNGRSFLKLNFINIVKNILTLRYQKANMLFLAFSEFMKGPDHLMEQFRVAPEFHEYLSSILKNEPIDGVPTPPKKAAGIQKRTPLLTRILISLTLNGHLLPDVFFKPDPERAIVDFENNKLKDIFLYKTVVYHDPHTNKSFVHRHDKKTFFSLLFRTAILTLKGIIVMPILRKKYQNAYPQMVSEGYWRSVLGVPDRFSNRMAENTTPEYFSKILHPVDRGESIHKLNADPERYHNQSRLNNRTPDPGERRTGDFYPNGQPFPNGEIDRRMQKDRREHKNRRIHSEGDRSVPIAPEKKTGF
ncbi:MAG: glycosyltransferase, partial [Leptospirales bacterium]